MSDRPFDLLAGGQTAIQNDFPDPQAHALVDSYLAGEIVSVCLCGQHSAQIERLEDVDEVWVFCFRAMKSQQWRIMGRFSKRDCFVGLSIYNRNEINTRRKYTQAANDFISIWNREFKNASPLRGTHWSDYLTGPVQDLDAPLP